MVVHWWKCSARSPPLKEHESVVSNVLEISTITGDQLEFDPEAKLVLSHSAPGLQGYELVIKKLINQESNEWEEVDGTEDLRCLQGFFFNALWIAHHSAPWPLAITDKYFCMGKSTHGAFYVHGAFYGVHFGVEAFKHQHADDFCNDVNYIYSIFNTQHLICWFLVGKPNWHLMPTSLRLQKTLSFYQGHPTRI